MAEKSERAQREEKVLSFWKKNKIFEKTLEKEAPEGEFVFYDGPPFATGLPHYGSLLSSIIKDVIPRYKTMRGFRVRRLWGWDCHGLPIENMVEKELGLKSKKEIEELGVAKFNRACRDSVLRFADEWKRFIDRIGRFVDYDHSYKTMDNTYIESVWWALKKIYEKGLLYEGRKVLLYCPHCETPLAKAEIAMDHSYKDVTEESVYIKFKVKGVKDSYLLAWTTTPWTLPGNVALAVGDDIDYVKAKFGQEILIMAEARLPAAGSEYEIIERLKGRQLVNLEYEPLYEISAAKDLGKKAWYVSSADFVSLAEGTGIVHTAVIYGEDDYELGLRLDLPMIPLLDASGYFNAEAPSLVQGQYFKKAETAIKNDLDERGLLFRREQYTHSYPHCHRCGTALLYNALSSWFIDIQRIKERMIALNEKISWVPAHLKHGRFLNIVKNAPDWTISRNRYWASPLPIWKDDNGKIYVIGSIDELRQMTKKSGNTYFVMRHGEAQSNVRDVLDLAGDPENHLTQKGEEEVRIAALGIKNLGINIIIASPFLRADETALILQKGLGLSRDSIITDHRLREVCPDEADLEVRQRMGGLIFEMEQKYMNKKILFISHGLPIRSLLEIASGQPLDLINRPKSLETAEVRELSFTIFPHNENYELDLHRPYIDNIGLMSADGVALKRIPEVLDGWVESGSMPFAECHYPFEHEEKFKARFPGDFVAEYIAQTRTWFYYMHAMAALLFDNISFRNVLNTGTILAEDGSKMSKSKGNYTDPMVNLDLFGADALRYYLMSSVLMQAEDIRFVNDEIRQVHHQVLNILWNSFKFYEIYTDDRLISDPHASAHILDRWILARLNELIRMVTRGMDVYDTVRATRPIKEFISDFSTWYIRRSRDRFRGDDQVDKAFAMATTRHVLLELSKLMAPVMPFMAEDIYRKIRQPDDPESVHLENWPTARKHFLLWSWFGWASDGEVLIRDMAETRRIVSLALEARSGANIKIRQPLSALRIKNSKLRTEFLDLIRDELNVKRVMADEALGGEIELDTEITPALMEEGRLRDVIRLIQDMRKKQGLKPGDQMKFTPSAGEEAFFEKHADEIKRVTNIEFS